MKNVQVIDGAANAAYDIWQITDELFSVIFPVVGQNVEFSDDLFKRMSDIEKKAFGECAWKMPVPKSEAQGIDGTIFYGLPEKKAFYPNKRESDLGQSSRGWRHP